MCVCGMLVAFTLTILGENGNRGQAAKKDCGDA
jgi:hypothetical protein